MDIHFNAFISYRHHPDDIKVAMEVHRALERYRIPKSLKKKLNVRGPMRLFRDKEELPITSNLNDDIGEALRNSDYLIVICSVHTKESIWVQREIELFLSTHPRHRVLTVLASGEPYDVIPEILLYDDKVDPVTGETIRELVEPLSCDWRIGPRRAKREELPRLAAPLLGCAYDELRQRQKQYRTRRMVTFFSLALAASLGFSAYVLRNSMLIQQKNVQIQANLEEAQRNQSRHLATAALERLAEGDRLTAIALATAALPNENNLRPYVPEAEKALAEALGVYQEYAKTLAVGAVSPGSQAVISQFYTDPEGERLYLYDMRKHITVWDAATMENLGTWDHSVELLEKLIPASDGLALVKHSTTGGPDGLRCVSADGTVIWQVEDCNDVALAEDGTTVLAIAGENKAAQLLFLDLHTGKQLRAPVALSIYGEALYPYRFCPYTLREGMPILMEYNNYPEKKVVMFDWDTAQHKELPVELGDYPYMLLTAAGKLVAMSYGESEVFVGSFEDNRVNATLYTQVVCYDLQEGTVLWQTEITSPVALGESLHETLEGQILCQSGPVFQLLDPATGETVGKCEAGSGAIAVTVAEGHAQAILEDGHICYYWYSGNYCYEEKSLQSDLYFAAFGNNAYYSLKRLQNQVTVYRETEPPTLWGVKNEYPISIRDQWVYGDQWLFTDGLCLYMFDLQTRQFCWTLDTGIRDVLGFSDDGTMLWLLNSDSELLTVDAATGAVTTTGGDLIEEDVYTGLFRDGKYFYTTASYTQDWTVQRLVKTLDLDTMDIASVEIPYEREDGAYIRYELAEQRGQYLWLWDDSQTLWELELTTGQRRVLAEQIPQCPVIAFNEDGTAMAVTAMDRVLVTAPGSLEIQTISMEADTLAGSLYFYGSELLVLCDDGYLYRYDRTGTLLGYTELEVDESFANNLLDRNSVTPATVSWERIGEEKLIVNAFNQGNVVDCENWKVTVSVPAYQLYRQADHSFVCNSYYADFAGYPVYSLEELLQLAGQTLGSFSLSREQKLAYGIG